MWKNVATPAVVLLSVVLSSAIGDQVKQKEAPAPARVKRSMQSQGVDLNVVVDVEYVAGKNADCRIEIRNRSDKTLVYFYGSSYRDFYMELVDADRRPVPRTRFGSRLGTRRDRSSGRATRELKAGESRTEDINLARVFDLSVPGKYTLSVKTVLNELELDAVNLALDNIPIMVRDP